jgi:hypothetical protein
MTDEGARTLTGNPDEKAWFVKKSLDFKLPEEIAKKQQIYDFANHLESLQNTIVSSTTRI